MPASFQHFAPTRLVFGDGVLDSLPAQLDFGSRFLLVTGKGSARASGTLDRIVALLGTDRVAVYEGISPNPRTDEVDAAAALGREFRADAVIGLGGGSALDAAKGAAVGIGSGRPVAELMHSGEAAPASTLPVIAIPTTSGTGSETSRGAILSDPHRGIKKGLRGERLLPRLAIVDPSLTWSAPRRLSLETGFDVLTHALETWVSGKAGIMSGIFAAEAISRVARFLPRLAADLADREARSELSFASMLMGINLANSSTCLPHRLQYPAGARTDCTHPAGLAALYPAWCRAAAPCRPEPFAVTDALLRSRGESRSSGDAARCAESIEQLLADLGIACRLSDFGLTEADIPGMVADVERVPGTDPSPADDAALSALYRASL